MFFRNREILFVDKEAVRRYRTLNNVFAQAPSAFDHDVLIIAGSQINRKHNARCFREYHHLNDGRKRHFEMIEALFYTVIHGAVGEGGSVAFFNAGNYFFFAFDVQIGILLTGKAGVG